MPFSPPTARAITATPHGFVTGHTVADQLVEIIDGLTVPVDTGAGVDCPDGDPTTVAALDGPPDGATGGFLSFGVALETAGPATITVEIAGDATASPPWPAPITVDVDGTHVLSGRWPFDIAPGGTAALIVTATGADATASGYLTGSVA